MNRISICHHTRHHLDLAPGKLARAQHCRVTIQKTPDTIHNQRDALATDKATKYAEALLHEMQQLIEDAAGDSVRAWTLFTLELLPPELCRWLSAILWSKYTLRSYSCNLNMSAAGIQSYVEHSYTIIYCKDLNHSKRLHGCHMLESTQATYIR